MQELRFIGWLQARYENKRTQETIFNDCRRIERLAGDLDDHFDLDEMVAVISGYLAAVRTGNPYDKRIHTLHDLYEVSSSYRSSARRYRDFRQTKGSRLR